MKRAAIERKIINRQQKLCKALNIPIKDGRSRKYKPISCDCWMCNKPVKREKTMQELKATGGK